MERTKLQNNALHKYCKDVADELNNAGISYKMLLEGLEISNTMESIKNLFRLIGGAKFRKWSTTELSSKELMEIFEDLNLHFGNKGIHVAWPSAEYNFLET